MPIKQNFQTEIEIVVGIEAKLSNFEIFFLGLPLPLLGSSE